MTRQTTTLTVRQSPDQVSLSVRRTALADTVQHLRVTSKSKATRRAYVGDLGAFATWCNAMGYTALPADPQTVSEYLADNAERLTVATLRRHLSTISKAHQVAGLPNPCKTSAVADTVTGIRKTHGRPQDTAPGLLADGMRTTLDSLSTDLAGYRDRALLLVGWCAGLRRSELSALTWGDVQTDPADSRGRLLLIRRSKTDQVGAGERVPIALDDDLTKCPVTALEQWRTALANVCGADAVAPNAPILRQVNRHGQVRGNMSGQAVAFVISRTTQQAGLAVRYRGHSLRKGLVQQAGLAGVSDSAVMATTRHRSVAMLRVYQEQVGLVTNCASRGLL